MTDAPVRIWAWHYVTDKRDDLTKGGWNDEPDRGLVEYVRKDQSADRLAAAERLAEEMQTLILRLGRSSFPQRIHDALAAWEASK